MAWAKLDDGFPESEKVQAIGDRSFRLHVTAICYAARNLTDGEITERALKVCALVAGIGQPRRNVEQLVSEGLWHPPGEPCDSDECIAPSNDGWVIHDYLQCNRSADDVKEERRKNRDRQRKLREQRNAERNGGSNDVTNDVSHATQSSPGPSGLTAKGSTARGTLLPIEKGQYVLEWLAWIGTEADEGTAGVVRAYVADLPVGALAKVEESRRATRVRKRAAWLVGTLKRELSERAA